MTPLIRLTTLGLLLTAGTTFAADSKTPAGTEFKDCEVCPVMVVMPTGSFMMGSPDSEAHRNANEGPQHRVRIGKPFAVGKFEVTWAEFKAFVDETGYNAGDFGRRLKNRNDSAVNISFNDAVSFVEWMSNKTGSQYRLLTEAEWEYVVRAGTSTPYPFHSSAIHLFANTEGEKDGFVYVAPFDFFGANKFGLHNMQGNVMEWTQDCWNENYTNAPTDGSSWLTGNCNLRVLRGGSWNDEPARARSASRYVLPPDFRLTSLGFRVARTL